MKHRIGRRDIVFIIVIVILGMAFLGYQYFTNQDKGGAIEITVDGEAYGTYPLSKNQEILIKEDEQVKNTVVIAEGEAYMQEADCPDHLCMKQGHISKVSESIVCLPNKVVVTVVSGDASEYDSMAQ